MAKGKAIREIRYVKYVKSPNGQTDKWGRKKYNLVGKTEGKITGKTYKQLKVDAYNKAKKSRNSKDKVYANFADRFSIRKRRVLVSTTKVFANGSRETTYYK